MKGIYQVVCQILLLSVTVIFAGCSKRYSDLPAYWPFPFREYQNQSVGRFKTSYLAEQVDAYYRGTDPGPIGITTLVNVDDLYSTSTFGRMYAEQLMSELAMKGYDVIELRQSNALQFLSAGGGEFGLSRDTNQIQTSRKLGAILVGTYTISPDRVYVNVRLLNPKTSSVLSAGSIEMDKTSELRQLLRGGSIMRASLERIPVQHVGFSTYPAARMPSYMREEEDYEGQRPAPLLPEMPIRAESNPVVNK